MSLTPDARLICGVDLGISGAVVFLDPAGGFVRKFPMPTLRHACGKELADVVRLRSLMFDEGGPGRYDPAAVRVVAMEAIGVFGMHARKSILSFGRGTGRTEAFFELYGYATQLVRPQDWKGAVLRGTARDKAAAVAYASFRWPDAQVGSDHDLADALCLAEYVRRQIHGGE